MKKLLLVTTAIAGVAFMSAPASAAIDLDVGGYFRGYVVSADNDLPNVYEEEFRRDSELHVSGETTLDNGLTVGAHAEMNIANNDGVSDSVDADEMYAYFSSGFGRINLGVEDGAAYLLQVEAPSADANIDGMVTSIEGISDSSMNLDLVAIEAFTQTKVQYGQRDFSESDRITYMSPKFNGFQAGVSYTPRPNVTSAAGAMNSADNTVAGIFSVDTGVAVTNTASQYKDPIEVSARYDGEYQGFGFAIGAGYSKADLEARVVETLASVDVDTLGVASGTSLGATATDGYWQRDDVDTYNAGMNIMFQNFSLGGSYMKSETTLGTDFDVTAAAALTVDTADLERETYVIGAAYDNGPYHVGASYLNQETTQDAFLGGATAVTDDMTGVTEEVDKFTVGGGYSFGPGMTFRGAVAWGEREISDVLAVGVAARNPNGYANGTQDFTQITLGTDIKF